jgi:hypothetical protein
MPIAQKDLGKYRRPGIYIEEIDQSVITLPVQDVLINLVTGFSRKGPINNPIYTTNPNDFKTIFGDIDRRLENDQSYFHRTCLKMLESGPIWALNLLRTEDDRDKIQWLSLATATKFSNYGTTSVKEIPYSKIFNRQDFWEKDEVAFLDYLKTLTGKWSSDRLFELVNIRGKSITCFVFKSDVKGFDITAEDWYEGANNVPDYVFPQALISDYMIDVLVLEGDWTDYNNLSVDSTWSNYFTSQGLIKDNIQNFVNERNVTVLGNYDVSLLPYFKDQDGRDLYIRSVINTFTDVTGLFCTYNEDKILKSDYPLEEIDLIGYGLVDSAQEAIDFLSYNQSIIEEVTVEEKKLDSAGNVFGNYAQDMSNEWNNAYSRTTGQYTNWYTNDITTGSTINEALQIIAITGGTGQRLETNGGFPTGSNTSEVLIRFNRDFGVFDANNDYYAYNAIGNFFEVKDSAGYPITGMTLDVVSGNNIVVLQNWMQIEAAAQAYYVIDTVQTPTTGTSTLYFEPLPIVDITEDYTRTDVVYLTKNSGVPIVSSANDYVESENQIVLGLMQHTYSGSVSLTSEYIPVTIDGSGYLTLDSSLITISDDGVDSISLDFSQTGATSYHDARKDKVFDEIVEKLQAGASQAKMVLIDYSGGTKHHIGTGYGIVGETITINNLADPNKYYSGQNFLFFYVDDELVISAADTDRLLTTDLPLEDLAVSGVTGVNAAGVIGVHSTFYQKYYDGEINNDDYFWRNNDEDTGIRIYLRMYVDNSNDLTIDFVNSAGSSSPEPIKSWTTNYDNNLVITSQTGNLKQTLELENTSQYTDLTNVREVYVDKTRYSEVTVGNFLEAYYIASAIEIGEQARTLVRITRTYDHPTNINWKVLVCDGPVKITLRDGDYQTTSYTQIDDYIDTYQALKMKAFKISEESIPDGTDEKQADILSVIDKSTNLAKALANKRKISWRYLIDSFGLGLDVSQYPGGSKQQYVDLCGMKKNCLGFISMPSARDFKNSSNPSFIDENGALDSLYVSQGGNPDRNPSFLYQFGDGVGRSTVGYFFPYCRINDDGIPRWVPPAMYVADAYMQKFAGNVAGIDPWTIVAGVTNGRVVGIGDIEFDPSDEDLENFSQMGANPLVKTPSGIIYINDENTAQVNPVSSLSFLHSREVLIELENRIYDMLLTYQWKFNTPEIRAEIKYKADKICRDLQDANALYNFRNVCDENNNPNYIIDLQMGVLDTYIEIIKGMGVIINNITILKKGDIESSGF